MKGLTRRKKVREKKSELYAMIADRYHILEATRVRVAFVVLALRFIEFIKI